MPPFTLLELTTQIKKLFPDKSSGSSGITHRMIQAGDAEFQSLFLLLFNGICESHVQPTDWLLSLMQPIYKGHDKDKTNPASYRGMPMIPWPNFLKTSFWPDLRHTLILITLSPLTNLSPNLAHRHTTLLTLSFPPSNTTSMFSRNLHMWSLLTTPQSTPQCTRQTVIYPPAQ